MNFTPLAGGPLNSATNSVVLFATAVVLCTASVATSVSQTHKVFATIDGLGATVAVLEKNNYAAARVFGRGTMTALAGKSSLAYADVIFGRCTVTGKAKPDGIINCSTTVTAEATRIRRAPPAVITTATTIVMDGNLARLSRGANAKIGGTCSVKAEPDFQYSGDVFITRVAYADITVTSDAVATDDFKKKAFAGPTTQCAVTAWARVNSKAFAGMLPQVTIAATAANNNSASANIQAYAATVAAAGRRTKIVFADVATTAALSVAAKGVFKPTASATGSSSATANAVNQLKGFAPVVTNATLLADAATNRQVPAPDVRTMILPEEERVAYLSFENREMIL